jgi:hypothetical protein
MLWILSYVFVSFICKLPLLNLYMWYFSSVFKCFPFLCVLMISMVYVMVSCLCSTIGVVTRYRLHDRGVGVRVTEGARFFSSPRRPDRFWGPPTFLSNGHRRRFQRGWGGRSVWLTTLLQLLLEMWIYISIPCPTRLHGVVLNWLSTGTTLPLLFVFSTSVYNATIFLFFIIF